MKKIILVFFAGSLLCLFSGCGRKGPLQEPWPRVPQKVEDFRAIQRGGKIFFFWTNPERYLDGNPLEIASTQIWACQVADDRNDQQGSRADFLKIARPLTELKIGQLELQSGQAIFSLNPEKTIGKKFVFGLRVKGKKGDWSDFSNLITLKILLLPQPPEKPKAECFEDKIVLSWQSPAVCFDGKTKAEIKGFNVYRLAENEWQKINPELLSGTIWEDKNFSFGQAYIFLIRAVTGEGSDFRESGDSEIIQITPQDVFPPASPAEPQILVSGEGVSLSWLPNQEKDLAGYRVYRMKEGEIQPVLLTPELLTSPVFYDPSVEKNCLYVYSITSVDKVGNESPPRKIQVRT